MKVLVIYDITDDALREKVASILKGFGLARVQKSAFLGTINSSSLKELKVVISKLIRGERANVQFYPLCRWCYSLRDVMGVPTVEEGLLHDQQIILV